MKSRLQDSIVALVASVLVASGAGRAMGQAPKMPASPLAGGAAAAQGGAFMDAHGNRIVMPASYGQPYASYGEACPDGNGYGADCYGDGAGYGAGGPCVQYADFGGYSSPDQTGPHYFDVAVFGVGLMAEDLFQDVLPFAAIGTGDLAPRILNPDSEFDDVEAGWQIALRYDLGPLSVLEAQYMGIYDIGFNDTIRSEDVANGQPNQLTSVFSDYGLIVIDGLVEGEVFSLDYESDLQSTEFSYRRYWVGYSPRVSGTYLAGFRYIRLSEDLNFNTIADDGNANLFWNADNDLVGAQFGGDGWVTLRQGLRVGSEVKAGVYNNRFKFGHVTNIPDPAINDVDFHTDGNQVAFAGESTIDLVADILPSVSLRAGYRVLYLNSLATVGNNIDPNEFDDMTANSTVLTQAHAFYHGFHGGIEYIW
jgi:hypothetical protein